MIFAKVGFFWLLNSMIFYKPNAIISMALACYDRSPQFSCNGFFLHEFFKL
jgi:hypothetical protein